MSPVDPSALVNTIIQVLPGVIGLIRGEHSARNPDAPALTDEEVFTALNEISTHTLEKDDAWLRAKGFR